MTTPHTPPTQAELDSMKARFWRHVDWTGASREEDCWNWKGCKSKKGYGEVSRSFYGEGLAHRVSFALFNGSIGDLLVCHKCNNPSCVRPSHLYLATNAQNIKDAWRDGLGRNGNSVKICCSKCGGPFKAIKIGRYCPACKKGWNRKYAAARKAAEMQQKGEE